MVTEFWKLEFECERITPTGYKNRSWRDLMGLPPRSNFAASYAKASDAKESYSGHSSFVGDPCGGALHCHSKACD